MTCAATSPTCGARGGSGAAGRPGDRPVLRGAAPGLDELTRSRTVGPLFD